jgi:hypothetical protein
LGAGLPDSETVFDKPPLEEIPEPTFPIDPKLRNRVTEELKTTVSQLPLELMRRWVHSEGARVE